MEKPIIDSGKKEPAVLAQKNGIPKVCFVFSILFKMYFKVEKPNN